MSERILVLFDDAVARAFRPFTLTRPAGELLFGACLQRRRAERVLDARCAGYLTEPHLVDFDESGAPPVLATASDVPEATGLYLSSRAVPAWQATLPVRGSHVLTIGGEPCGWLAPPGSWPPGGFIEDPARYAPADVPRHELGGLMLQHVWDLVSLAETQLVRDIAALAPPPSTALPTAGVYRLGGGPLALADNVTIEPQVVLDTRTGPIWLDEGVTVRAFSYLRGPVYVGPGSVVLGGEIEASTIGPVCRVHGQVEASVLLGYDNKAHAGFLGHAYLGRWVNLGAATTNSDLKNNYRPVQLWTPAGPLDTGLVKLGCFLGDHVKTGIGTLLNTGTVIGAGCNLYGAALPPRYVPPFSWGSGDERVVYDLDKFLASASAAMARRDVELSQRARALLRQAWETEKRA